jgi:hypothetical protein
MATPRHHRDARALSNATSAGAAVRQDLIHDVFATQAFTGLTSGVATRAQPASAASRPTSSGTEPPAKLCVACIQMALPGLMAAYSVQLHDNVDNPGR